MPDIGADELERLADAIFAGAGSSAEEAATVARVRSILRDGK